MESLNLRAKFKSFNARFGFVSIYFPSLFLSLASLRILKFEIIFVYIRISNLSFRFDVQPLNQQI